LEPILPALDFSPKALLPLCGDFHIILYRPRSGDKALDKSPRPVNYFLSENSLSIQKTKKKKIDLYYY
jgi:hypothetical protein